MPACIKCDAELAGAKEYKVNTLTYAICKLCGKVYIKNNVGDYIENRRQDLPQRSWPENA